MADEVGRQPDKGGGGICLVLPGFYRQGQASYPYELSRRGIVGRIVGVIVGAISIGRLFDMPLS